MEKNFTEKAINSGISKNVVDEIMSGAVFYQKLLNMTDTNQNFMKTHLHIKKRSSNRKIKEGLNCIKKKNIIENIENEFQVEKELH